MVKVEILRNNWGEKKWNKLVEKSMKESVKAFFAFEEFNSRVFIILNFLITLVSALIIWKQSENVLVAIISITSKQMANH